MTKAAIQLDFSQVIAVLARTLAGVGPATTKVGGKVSFWVEEQPRERWTVCLDEPGGRWHQGQEEDWQTAVVGTEEALAALVLDPDRVPMLLAGHALRVLGNRSKLGQISQLLASAGTILSQQIMNVSLHRRNRL